MCLPTVKLFFFKVLKWLQSLNIHLWNVTTDLHRPTKLRVLFFSSCKMSATWREDTHHTETQKGQTLRERGKEAARERRRHPSSSRIATRTQMQSGTKAWTFSVPPLHFLIRLIWYPSSFPHHIILWNDPCGHNFGGRFTIVPHKLNPLLCCKSRPHRLHLKIEGVDISSYRCMIFRPSGFRAGTRGHVQPKLKITLVVSTRSFEDYSSGFM